MISLRRFQSCTEENHSIIGKMMSDDPEQRPRILQVLREHRRNDSFVSFSRACSIQVQSILHTEGDPVRET